MKKPKMILFDFGETLTTEIFNPSEGIRAVMEKAVKNPENVSYKDVADFALEIINEAQGCAKCENPSILETHMFHFNRYVYEYFGIEFNISPLEIEQIFFNASITSMPTPNIEKLLEYLDNAKIRTAVISNIMYSEQTLTHWIQKDLPLNNFEFIIASSEYLFRKPSNRIFNLALKKAGLNAEDAWYCGNNSYFDVIGAHLSGLFPVWYKGANWAEEGGSLDFQHKEISDWNELLDLGFAD